MLESNKFPFDYFLALLAFTFGFSYCLPVLLSPRFGDWNNGFLYYVMLLSVLSVYQYRWVKRGRCVRFIKFANSNWVCTYLHNRFFEQVLKPYGYLFKYIILVTIWNIRENITLYALILKMYSVLYFRNNLLWIIYNDEL